jgi:hypothetical protein
MSKKVTHVVACGPTGAHLSRDKDHYVIGVNDAAKFGHSMNALLFLNAERQFTLDRQEIIRSTKVEKAICIEPVAKDWAKYWPVEVIKTSNFPQEFYFDPKVIYTTNSSAFTAMSYAFTVLGATDIILHGVDFLGHKFLKFEDSAPAFTKFDKIVRKYGCQVYRGSKENRLVLQLWN